MQCPRGLFPSRTPSQFSTKAYRNSARYAISALPSRLQHRIMGSPGKDKQSMIALPSFINSPDNGGSILFFLFVTLSASLKGKKGEKMEGSRKRDTVREGRDYPINDLIAG